MNDAIDKFRLLPEEELEQKVYSCFEKLIKYETSAILNYVMQHAFRFVEKNGFVFNARHEEIGMHILDLAKIPELKKRSQFLTLTSDKVPN